MTDLSGVSRVCLPLVCPTLDSRKPRIHWLCWVLSGVSRVVTRARVRAFI